MAQTLSIEQFPQFNFFEIGEITTAVAEGGTSLPVRNEDNFDTNHAILVGDPADENAEIRTPSNIADEDITIDALDHPHVKGTKIYSLRGNKVRVYRAPNVDGLQPTTDTYSLLDTVVIQADQLEIEYTDASGSSSFWYLFTFYNDIVGPAEETEKVLTDSIRGGNIGNFSDAEAVRREAGLQANKYISNAFIYKRLIEAESEVNASLILANYVLPISYVPAFLKNATELLAAGYVLTTDYGSEHEGTNKDGNAKIKQAREILMRIEKGELQLLDESLQPITQTRHIRGYPDDEAEGKTPSEARKFTMQDKF